MGGTIAMIAISTLVSAISGYMGAQAQKEAYQTLANATEEEKRTFKAAYDQAYGEGSYNSKMQELGLGAANDISKMLGDQKMWDRYVSGEKAWKDVPDFSFTAEDLYSDPSYQTRLDEGRKALEESLVVNGYGGTGYAAKELEKYAQEQAAKEYAAAYGRKFGEYTSEKNFDFNAWKTEADQYYKNISAQLAGLQGLSSQGAQANANQTFALMSLAGKQADAGIQAATAQAAANQADMQKLTSGLDALAKGLNTGAGVYAAYDSYQPQTNTTVPTTTPTNTNGIQGSNPVVDYGNTPNVADLIQYAFSQPSTSNLTMGA